MGRSSVLHDDKPIKPYKMVCGHEILLRTAPHPDELVLYCTRCRAYKLRLDTDEKG